MITLMVLMYTIGGMLGTVTKENSMNPTNEELLEASGDIGKTIFTISKWARNNVISEEGKQ